MTLYRKTYLGDGVYASYDGYHIALETERDGQTVVIYIEPAVWMALVEYQKYLKSCNEFV